MNRSSLTQLEFYDSRSLPANKGPHDGAALARRSIRTTASLSIQFLGEDFFRLPFPLGLKFLAKLGS